VPVSRGFSSQLLTPDLRRVYFEEGKERPLEYEQIANVEDMEWNPIKDLQTAGLETAPTKAEGAEFTRDQPLVGGTKTYTAVASGKALEFTYEAWKDELYGVFQETTRSLARSMRDRQETDFWSLINNGFSTSFTGFTASESLFSTSHARLDGGTAQANRPSPDIGLSVTGLQAMSIRFENMVNERGMPQALTPVLVVCSPANKFVAREILSSVGKPFTADNEINALIEEDLSWMIVHGRLTTTTTWFAAATKGVHDLNFFWRDRPQFDSFDDPRNKNAIFTAYQRYAFGFGSYRGVDGSF